MSYPLSVFPKEHPPLHPCWCTGALEFEGSPMRYLIVHGGLTDFGSGPFSVI
ncbi:MAG: hypothetical protein R6U13_08215 [Desulfatiglandaceae bacterium]